MIHCKIMGFSGHTMTFKKFIDLLICWFQGSCAIYWIRPKIIFWFIDFGAECNSGHTMNTKCSAQHISFSNTDSFIMSLNIYYVGSVDVIQTATEAARHSCYNDMMILWYYNIVFIDDHTYTNQSRRQSTNEIVNVLRCCPMLVALIYNHVGIPFG